MNVPLRGRTSPSLLPLLLAAVSSGVSPAAAQEHVPHAAAGKTLGQVDFPTSCAPEVQGEFNRAVAMLHSFWYQAAERAFTEILAQEPDCAMAHWGVGMSRFHQLWERPTAEDVRVGERAYEAAAIVAMATGLSARESGYVAGLGEIFAPAAGADADYPARKLAYEHRMEALHAEHPDDPEAAIFHALALLGSAASLAADPTYARQRKARAILEVVLAEHPDHPGVAHYLIHGTDYPELASEGIEAARRYARIAPEAPHALHMPSHIFTRLGLWTESIDSNLAAAAAARRAGWTGEELHASDYLVHAYLQKGRLEAAGKIVERLPEMQGRLADADPNYPAGLYALAAIPARYAVERRQWDEAAALEAPGGWFPADRYCWAEATLTYARGLGAAHTDDPDGGREAVAALLACEDSLRDASDDLWANRVLVDRHILEARLVADEGRTEEAVAILRAAAGLEDRSDKPPITPGSVLPAREALGELLLDLDRPGEALAAFEIALTSSPRRLRPLERAVTAAKAAGRAGAAATYQAEIAELKDR